VENKFYGITRFRILVLMTVGCGDLRQRGIDDARVPKREVLIGAVKGGSGTPKRVARSGHDAIYSITSVARASSEVAR